MTRHRADHGGMPARRAVARWSWRLFRREWRQQVLVVVLITVAVTMTVAAASAAYNMTPSGAVELGTGSHRLVVDAADRDAAAVELRAIDAWFGTTEHIRVGSVAVPGSADDLELRAQAPDGPFGATLLAVRDGRFPRGGEEIAVTEDVAATFGATVGSTLDLGGVERTVVGIVENPADLADGFALVAPSATIRPDTVEVLVDASDDEVRSRPDSGSTANPFVVGERGGPHREAAVLTVYLVAAVVLLLVALVAAAGFVVMAQRRQRQIGLLAAMGATGRQVRFVMVANGLAVGVTAAVVGTAIGLAAWVALAPRLEAVAEHRIDRADVPWWLVAVGMLLAVWTATAASWWPARAVARMPVTAALAERPPTPRPARRSTVLAAVLVAAGVGLIWWSDPNRMRTRPALARDLAMVAGVVVIVVGILLLAPIAVRTVGRAAHRLPLTGRLALRDLARFPARSGMALGAISLAVGIPIAVVITSAAAQADADVGNLPADDLLLRIGDAEGGMVADAEAAAVEDMAAQVDRLAEGLGATDGPEGAAVVPLAMAMEPASERLPGYDVRQAVAVGLPVDENTLQDVVTYVATPAVVDDLGLDPQSLDDIDLLTVRSEPLHFLTTLDRTAPPLVSRRATLQTRPYSSGPTTLLTPAAARRYGWDTVPVGWLVHAPAPLTGEQVRLAREAAADAGMTVEVRRATSTSSLRMGAIGAGSALALAVVAMTVGIVRAEAAGDLRILAATGASGSVRRRLTAWTAGALGVLGVVLGGAGAYVALASGYARDLGALGDVPFVELAIIAAGVPVSAAVAGWALGGREPSSLLRQDG